MIIKIVSALRHFRFDGIDKHCLHYIDFSDDYELLKTNFFDKNFYNQFGLIAEITFNKDWCFAYTILEDELNESNGKIDYYQYALSTHVERYVDIMQSFHSFLWFVKDNCCISSDIFGQGLENGTFVFTSRTTGGRYSNSLGEFNDVSFTLAEIETALIILRKFNEIKSKRFKDDGERLPYSFFQDKLLSDTVIKADDKPELYNEFNRLERAFRFLNSARATHYLPHKIAMYIPVLECLFSTEAAEATQKVSERVAFYLSDDKEIRRKIFDIIKIGYNIRSRYLHGSVIDKKERGKDFQGLISKELDNLIRCVLVRIIMQDSEKFLGPLDKDDKEKFIGPFLKNLIFQ